MLKSKLGKYIKIQHGFAFKSENYVSKSQYALVTLANISESNTFKYSETKTTYYGADFPKNVILVKGDLVLPLTEQVVGLLGNSALIPFIQNIKFVLNQRVGRIRLLNNEMDKYYLHYLLSTNLVKKQLEARACGTKQRNISPEDVYDVTVFLPSYNIQQKIGNFLYLIEQKIELNNKINAALENVAKDLYNYWFVQFDFPDGNGRPYKSSGGKMVYNKVLKREMPEGWDCLFLEKRLNFDKGFEFGPDSYVDNPENTKEYVKFYRVGDMDDTGNTYVSKTIAKDAPKLESSDFSVSFDGSVGKIVVGIEGTYSSGIRKISDKLKILDRSTLYFIFKDECIQKTIKKYATGSNILHASASISHLCIPYNENIYMKYQDIISVVYKQLVTNKINNKNLRGLRDFLLPMLMNGQVEILD